jgi:hypothetical protein
MSSLFHSDRDPDVRGCYSDLFTDPSPHGLDPLWLSYTEQRFRGTICGTLA